MTPLSFRKMQGSGNDFIMIDNRAGCVQEADKVTLVRALCPRATAVGADGVIFIETDPTLDFAWHFFNADGSEAEMCGNGARCAAVFAHAIGAADSTMTFRTLAGPIDATLVPGGARVRLTDAPMPELISALQVEQEAYDLFFTNTGVPHIVLPVTDLNTVELRRLGAAIRHHAHFQPAGTNVNFMVQENDTTIAIRTYERGVEDETLACGTGSVAAALTAAQVYQMQSPLTVRTRSGARLTISFTVTGNIATEIYLEGPAVTVYEGQLSMSFMEK